LKLHHSQLESSKVLTVSTITDRDKLKPTKVIKVCVLNIGDGESATYIYDLDNNDWIELYRNSTDIIN
jgi:hypothetical protein